MGKTRPGYEQIQLFFVLAVFGLVAQLNHVHIPHTDVLIEGRWAFGFMGFALLRRWWAAVLLAVLLSTPWGTEVPVLIGMGGNLSYAIPALGVIRPLHRVLLRRFGPGWIYGAGWVALVMFCYQAFNTPVVWGVLAWMNREPIWAGVVAGWVTQPFLVEAVLVSLFSAVAMVAALTHQRMHENQRRLEHINRVLRGIRNVNQLIVSEDDPRRLIEGGCTNLAESMGYTNVWVAWREGAGRWSMLGPVADEAGFDALRERVDRGALPDCVRQALETDETIAVADAQQAWGDWVVLPEGDQWGGFARRLRHGESVYGVLVAFVPAVYAEDAEERALFEEVASDLAFALHKIEAARRLRESREMLARTERIANVGSWEWEVATDRVTWSEELFRLFGLEPAAQAPSFAEHQAMYLPGDRERLVAAVDECVRHGTAYELAVRLRRADGEIRHCLVRGRAERDMSGVVVRLMGSLQDITSLKRTEEALRERGALLSKAEELGRSGAWKFDVQTGVSTISENWRRLVGLTGAVVDWEELWMLLPEEERPRLRAALDRALAGIEPYNLEHDLIRKSDGERITIHSLGEVVRDAGNKPVSVFGVSQDITARKRAEAALRESEWRWRHILVETPQIGVSLDPTGRIVFANKRLLELTDYREAEVLGHDWFDLFIPEEVRAVFRTVMQSRDTLGFSSFENEILTRAGERRLIAWSNVISKDTTGEIVDVTCLGIDVTERERAEQEREKLCTQLAQSQKMESVGRLAGGVAHDFNNMLTAILGHAEMAAERLRADDPLRRDIEEISKAAQRSANLTRQLLAFARRQTVAPEVLHLNDVIDEMLKMLGRLIGEDINLVWQPAEGLPTVRIDPAQVDQMLVNLVVNARDAISGVGHITIETAAAECDEAYCAQHAGFTPGRYVMLAVSDDGCGMDAATQANVFEPFFTTKGVGGTGLGLATVYGIVKQNRGFINVYSEPGEGTTFRIYLPQYSGAAVSRERAAAAAPTSRGAETILLVEDEPTILALGATMLERQGYDVLAAATPGEAIRLAEEHGGELDLLITDVVMPEMNGRDLAKRLLSLYPRLKRVFMSGYTANVVAHQGVLEEGINFLQKPFSMQSLAAKAREALDQ